MRSGLITHRTAGFTLLEIMVVVGILAVVTAVSVAVAFKTKSKPPALKAIAMIEEVCKQARTDAIVNRRIRNVQFKLEGQERYVELMALQPSVGQAPSEGAATQGKSKAAPVTTGFLPELVPIDPIGVFTVSFRPDGTCDGLQLEVGSGDVESWVMVLEQSTGLVFVSAME